MSQKVLIVEGETDKQLMTKLLDIYKIKGIEIWPPKLGGSGGNGVNNLIECLKLALKGVRGGRHTHIGVIVDADYSAEHGYRMRRKLVADTFAEYGFSHNLSPGQVGGKGEVVSNGNYACRCGFWIMPNHQLDGMAETLLKSAIIQAQQPLLQVAVAAVNALQAPLFSQNHKDKAILSTWLAWQKWTGMPTDKAVERGFIDPESPAFVPFKSWLIETFEK
jgi:hypothetical protein